MYVAHVTHLASKIIPIIKTDVPQATNIC
jgi:hypothetical protein